MPLATFNPDVDDLQTRQALQRIKLSLDQTAPVTRAAPPTENDDGTKGYLVGKLWIDTDTLITYELTSPVTGAAVWKAKASLTVIAGGGGGVAGGGGPTAIEDEMVVRADGTDGKIQGSLVTIDEAGGINGAINLNVSGTVIFTFMATDGEPVPPSAVIALSGDTTLTLAHTDVTVDASGGAVTITLPPVATEAGKVYNVKKIDSSANVVTVDGDSSETIDGALTRPLATQYANLRIQAAASEWGIR